jgi:hypothetical protein
MPVPNETAGRVDYSWHEPTPHGNKPMSPEEFQAIRDKGTAERAGVEIAADGAWQQLSKFEQLSKELGHNCGLPRPAAIALARELSDLLERCAKLEAQVTGLQQQLARNNPPHLSKVEKRTA